ncbi:hypothetical protein FOCC_FOCC015425 [Frankliniella occidentalis]|nr:hypothetical protein FOCC_FOCC015425 [Frankliniella occidentalis]
MALPRPLEDDSSEDVTRPMPHPLSLPSLWEEDEARDGFVDEVAVKVGPFDPPAPAKDVSRPLAQDATRCNGRVSVFKRLGVKGEGQREDVVGAAEAGPAMGLAQHEGEVAVGAETAEAGAAMVLVPKVAGGAEAAEAAEAGPSMGRHRIAHQPKRIERYKFCKRGHVKPTF